MNRVVYTIESAKGFLKDIEMYTQDILEAVTFTDFETACSRLTPVSGLLNEECWVDVKYVPFPRPKPMRSAREVFTA